MTTIVRRRLLGRSSAKGISSFSKKAIAWCRSDKGIPVDDMYIRWGCTSELPVPDAKVLNKAKAISEVNDKLNFRVKTADAGLSPTTWTDHRNVPDDALQTGVIIRPAKHAQGRKLWLVHTRHELTQRCMQLGMYYVSLYIRKVAEYRVFVVQGRVVSVAQKTPSDPNDIAWNVARGGRFDNVSWDNWPLKSVRVAIEAFNLSALDFGGVDIMTDAEGNAYVLEINSAPSLTSPYRQETMAKAFDYILEHGKARIPLVEQRGGYKKFIHPAINGDAMVRGA